MTSYIRILFGIFIITIFLSGCAEKQVEPGKSILETGNIQYFIHNPDKKFVMPGALEEISGIEMLNDSIILCVEDEKGKVYFYNQFKESIVHTIEFKKKGDFEDIAYNDSTIYVLRSDGRIYFFPLTNETSIEAEFVKTKLKRKNDAEGLTLFSENSLLIACKGKAEVNDNQIKGRAIYEYSLLDSQLIESPMIHLESNEFEKLLNEFQLNPLKHMPFGPSGIAVHPFTKDIFLIGTVGKLAIVMDNKGEIGDMGTLKPSVFAQPEGICFDRKGNLYISSEGKGGNGYILKFNYTEKPKASNINTSNGIPK